MGEVSIKLIFYVYHMCVGFYVISAVKFFFILFLVFLCLLYGLLGCIDVLCLICWWRILKIFASCKIKPRKGGSRCLKPLSTIFQLYRGG